MALRPQARNRFGKVILLAISFLLSGAVTHGLDLEPHVCEANTFNTDLYPQPAVLLTKEQNIGLKRETT